MNMSMNMSMSMSMSMKRRARAHLPQRPHMAQSFEKTNRVMWELGVADNIHG